MFVMWKEAFGLTALRQDWGQEPGHGAVNGDIAEAATVTPVTTGMIAQQFSGVCLLPAGNPNVVVWQNTGRTWDTARSTVVV